MVEKAAEASREIRNIKQDKYEEMRRRKDEEREAKERMLVKSSSDLISHLILH